MLDVNYGGSSGYGRQYRERLNKKWGIVDVDDCVNGARYLAERGEVDGERLIITGGSAGGYTTLGALTFRNTFKAGASHFGISNLESMARDTHKYESQYLTGLLGRYPERKDIYYERSPINFPERLSCPVIFFQGLEDKVVPPDQAETMVAGDESEGNSGLVRRLCRRAARLQAGERTSSKPSMPSFIFTRESLDSSWPIPSSPSRSKTCKTCSEFKL